jgi:hypothetical protein
MVIPSCLGFNGEKRLEVCDKLKIRSLFLLPSPAKSFSTPSQKASPYFVAMYCVSDSSTKLSP